MVEMKAEGTKGTKRIRIEATLLLPQGIGSSDIIAAMAEALERLPQGGEGIKIEKLKYDPW